MVRFYNPGPPINEVLNYTNTLKDEREGCTLSKWQLRAGEKEFFDVPQIITLQVEEGEATIPVGFPKIVKQQYFKSCVIMIDAKAKSVLEDDNLALNEKDARAKGDLMWRERLKELCQEWYGIVEETKAAGGVPKAAVGLYKYALKQMHMEDPADRVDSLTRAREGTQSNKDLQAQIAELTAKLNALSTQVAR